MARSVPRTRPDRQHRGHRCQGPLTGALAESVELLNRLSAIKPRPVIAIDVPSGLTDDDGAITDPILRATHTLTCEEPV